MKPVAGIALLGLGFAAWMAFAQEAPPALFGERVDVEVVNVDVVVTDRDGRRVTDLGRDDFELRIDGKAVPIEYFTAPTGGTETTELLALPRQPISPIEIVPRSVVDGVPQRLIVVFVDQSALGVHASGRIVSEIAEFVMPKMDGSTSVLVATFVDNLRVLVPMTSDWSVAAGALEELDAIRGRGSILERERTAIESDIRSVMVGVPLGDTEDDRRRRAEFIRSQRLRIESDIQQFGDRALDRQRRGVRALRNWMNALAAIEGRKSLLLASQGYSSEPATYLQRLLETTFRSGMAMQGVRENFSSTEALATSGRELTTDFEEMLHAAEDARVAVYTLSPRTPPVVQASAEMGGSITELVTAPPRDESLVEASSSLVRLGKATGGGNFYVDDALSRNLERVLDDERAVYSLGFTTGPEAGETAHSISVHLSRPGLRVRTRERFQRRTLPERARQALSAATTLAAASNPLGISIQFGDAEAGDEKSAIVPLLVRIPLRDLAMVPDGGRLLARLSAQVAILDAKGVQRLGPVVPIAVEVAAADEPRIATDAWAYRADMRLAPGVNRVAVAITDEVGGVIAATTATLDVEKKGSPK